MLAVSQEGGGDPPEAAGGFVPVKRCRAQRFASPCRCGAAQEPHGSAVLNTRRAGSPTLERHKLPVNAAPRGPPSDALHRTPWMRVASGCPCTVRFPVLRRCDRIPVESRRRGPGDLQHHVCGGVDRRAAVRGLLGSAATGATASSLCRTDRRSGNGGAALCRSDDLRLVSVSPGYTRHPLEPSRGGALFRTCTGRSLSAVRVVHVLRPGRCRRPWFSIRPR